MLKVIEFIKEKPNWREILSADPYNIRITDDGGFAMLKYSQIDSDLSIEIVRECRGLIIDSKFNPVCIPFFKFGNYGESYADEIDWTTARVEEKLDGSLIKVWNYEGRWIVSTNGTIFARNASINNSDGNYSNYGELFGTAADKMGLSFDTLNSQYTYMFELCSPFNRVVVPHDEIKLFHIGTRDNITLQELEIDISLPKPRLYKCNKLDELIKMAAELKYCEEGYVVRDSAYRRIKVKSPSYVAVHHLISGMGDKTLLELIRKNETAEFLTYFPEYQSLVDSLMNRISAFEAYINETINNYFSGVEFETRKNFAIVATGTKFPAFFFNWYDGKVKSPAEWLWNLTNDKILENFDKT
jgi:hypothetical protein